MTTTVESRCPFCGHISTITCEMGAWFRYMNGALIQDAFPTMDFHTRETLVSGLCLSCQESFFEEDEDECDGECNICADYNCPCSASLFSPLE